MIRHIITVSDAGHECSYPKFYFGAQPRAWQLRKVEANVLFRRWRGASALRLSQGMGVPLKLVQSILTELVQNKRLRMVITESHKPPKYIGPNY